MINTKSSWRALLAAAMIGLMGVAPALAGRSGRVVANAPGERFDNKPRPVPRREKPVSERTEADFKALGRADAKRRMKAHKRLWDQDRGGWAATSNWLSRVELRKAAGAAQ